MECINPERACIGFCLVLIAVVAIVVPLAVILPRQSAQQSPTTYLTSDGHPSLKVKVTREGLEFLKDIGLPLAVHQVKDIPLDDVEEDYLSLSRLNILDLTLGTSKITTEAPKTIRLTLQNVALSISGRWKFKSRLLSSHGDIDAIASGISINLAIAVGMDDMGKPTLTVGSCSASVANLSLKSKHTNIDHLWKKVLSRLKKILKKNAQAKICPKITEKINKQAKDAFSKIKVEYPLLKNVVVDTALAQVPVVTSQSVELLVNGRCFPKNNSAIKYPFPSTSITVAAGTDQMTGVVMGEFFFRSLVYSLWVENELDLLVTKDMLPKKYENITANAFTSFVLGSIKHKDWPIQFRIKVTKLPDFHIRAGVLEATVELDLLTYVILSNKTILALTLHVVTKGSGNISVDASKLTATVASMSATVSIKTSYQWEFLIDPFNLVVPKILRSYVIPAVNKKLQQGYPLPKFENFILDPNVGISYKTPMLELIEGALVGSCDWEKSP